MAELVEHTCPVCFIYYAIPERMERDKRKDGSAFFCPNGHSLSYRDNENDRIRRERDSLKQQMAMKDDQIRDAVNRAARFQKEVKRITKRVSSGVCPCCNRSFQQLARHMKTKHPDFKAEVVQLREGA